METVNEAEQKYLRGLEQEFDELLERNSFLMIYIRKLQELLEVIKKDRYCVKGKGFPGLPFELDINNPNCVDTIGVVLKSALHDYEATQREKFTMELKLQEFEKPLL